MYLRIADCGERQNKGFQQQLSRLLRQFCEGIFSLPGRLRGLCLSRVTNEITGRATYQPQHLAIATVSSR